VWWVKEPLDVARMARAARMLIGRHNFSCFRATDATNADESPIVVVENASIEQEDDAVVFRIEASHFVWRMARRLVGVLVRIGKGEVTEEDLARLLQGRSDPRIDVAAWTAPASGLFLESVRYDSPQRCRGR
jgi:tRNA pseudouridine38-40 synthase